MKKTKILAALLAGIMVISMLAGCGGGSSTVNGLELNDEVLKLEGYLASAEPLDLTVHYHQNNSKTYKHQPYKHGISRTG